MDIHQVSVNYLHEQDRILVRINTRQDEEIRLWLTRRLCVSWVPALRDLMGRMRIAPQATAGLQPQEPEQDAPGWTQEFKQLQSLRQTEFNQPFKSTTPLLPLGSEPLLVTTVRMTLQGQQRLDLAFEESLLGHKAQTRGFQASLETELLRGCMHLLEQALDQSQWQLPPPSAALVDALRGFSTEGADPADLGPGQPPRKYLH